MRVLSEGQRFRMKVVLRHAGRLLFTVLASVAAAVWWLEARELPRFTRAIATPRAPLTHGRVIPSPGPRLPLPKLDTAPPFVSKGFLGEP